MNTTESNKLIANFMGVKYKSDSDYIKDIEEMRGNGIFYDQGCFMESELKYNSSWDWLMPVVEKIQKLYEEGVYNNNQMPTDYYYKVLDKGISTVREIIYKSVVEFIRINNEIIQKNTLH